jgi:preprotein translocase subunit SecG
VEALYNALIVVLVILSVILIISIMMQPSKQEGGNIFSGGEGDLFERRKARGFEAVMQRFTGVMIGVWMLVGFALVILSSVK